MERTVLLFPKGKLKIKAAFSVAFILLAVLYGCGEQSEPAKKISLKKTSPLQSVTETDSKKTIRIAIGAMISPKETFISYKGILDYIHESLNIPVELVQRDTYEEVNNLVRDKEIEAALVCTGAYIDGHRDFGMELLVAPMVHGATVYYSYIIVPRSSNFQTLEDLRGESFAFTDPMSNTGKLSPTYLLSQAGEKPESFFSKTHFTYSHDRSIQAVASKIVAGAAVDSLVWDYLNTKNPVHTSKTRIISRSKPYGIPPVVVPAGLDPDLKKRLREIFLTMHENPSGRSILSEIMIDRFVEVEDSLYNSVREMEKWVNNPPGN